MSADVGSLVTTDALETLGTIITENEKRDAIHLAVEPVIAAEKLYPGQDVGLVDGCGSSKAPTLLGIVDPFLKGPVPPGERFWLVVYPRKINSLRHVWTCPGFPENEFTAKPNVVSDPVSQSRDWIAKYCAKIGCRVEEIMSHAAEWVDSRDGRWSGEYWCDGGRWSGEYWCDGGRWEGISVQEEFWEHYQRVIGKVIPKEKQGNFFTCSC